VVTALRNDSLEVEWQFLAFSLDQAHVAEGEPPVWERPAAERGTGFLALEWGVAVRDAFPEAFFAAHLELFAVRHDHGRRLHEEPNLRAAVAEAGLDADAVAAEVASGRPRDAIASEHSAAVERHGVFGVPTFIEGDDAVFVRFMERDRVDDLDRTLTMLGWTNLNEFKRARIPR
jgi:2-hydroxychromene-2-carboxylate isomerase